MELAFNGILQVEPIAYFSRCVVIQYLCACNFMIMKFVRKHLNSKINMGSSATSDYNIVGKLFHPLMLILKFFGHPVSSKQGGVLFTKPSLPEFLYALISTFGFVLAIIVYTLNRGFDVSWPVRMYGKL